MSAGAIAPKAPASRNLSLEDPVVALAGDRFVIRDETNSRTLGGGIVLNPLGRRVRKPLEAYRANLLMLKNSSGADAIEALINLQETFALGPSRIATLMNIPIAEADAALREAPRFIKLSIGDEAGFTTRTKWDALKHFALDALAAHHKREPLSPGLEMEALRTRLPYEIGARAFRPIVDRISHESEIVREESTLRLKSHRVQLGGAAETLGTRVEAALQQRRIPAPRSQATGRVTENSDQPTAAPENRAGRDGTRRPRGQNRHRILFQPRRRRRGARPPRRLSAKLTTRSPPRSSATCSAPRANSRSPCSITSTTPA